MRLFRLALLVLTGWLLLATPAQADPVTIAIAVTTALPFVSAAVDTFVFFAVQAAVYAGYTWAASKLASAGQKAQTGQERQASVTQLQIGESDREAIIGECATGGQLLDAFNYGGKYGTDWEVLVIAVADHRCEALSGFYIGDTYYAFSGSGAQSGFNGQLVINWHDGQLAQAADDLLVAQSGRWTTDDRAAGVAYVVVAYKADDPKATSPIWSTGRPNFLWLVKGARIYDPRKDSTVTGGSGAHRWSDPSTWEWSDNAALGRYAYVRGFYAGDQVDTPSALMIGRGLSESEAPAARIIAAANICDEMIALKAGGSERRYRANGVLRAGEPFIAIEEMFAAAMGGIIVQRDGGVEIEPGVAKSAVVTVTDGDLIIGEPVHIDNFTSQNERLNTVTPRFTDPAQIWRDTAPPLRRSSADIIADGGLYARSIPLTLVTTHTQAQRCGEIERRLGRKERRGSIVLGPRFSYLEDGDWISWQSDRYFDGGTVTFRIEAINIGADYRTSLVMREIAASVYAWTASTDEGTPGQAPVDEAGSLDPLSLDDVSIAALALTGDESSVIPAVQASWSTPVDVGVMSVRIELRPAGGGDVVTMTQTVPQLGQAIVSNGVPAASDVEVRVTPIGAEGREVVPTDWVSVTTPDLIADNARHLGTVSVTQAQDAVAKIEALVAKLTQEADATVGAVEAAGQKIVDRLAQYGLDLEALPGAMIERALDQRQSREYQTALSYDEAGVPIKQRLFALEASAGDNFALIFSDYATSASVDSAIASATTTLTADFGDAIATATENLITVSDAETAIAASATSLTTTFNGNIASAVSGLASTSDVSSAISSYNTSLQASVSDGLTATVSASATAVSELAGAAYGAYTIKVGAGNVWTGLQLLASSGRSDPSSQIILSADALRIRKPGTTGSDLGFTYDSGTGTLFVDNLTIKRGNIQGAAISTCVGLDASISVALTTSYANCGPALTLNSGSGADIFIDAFLYAQNTSSSSGQDVTVVVLRDGTPYTQKDFHINVSNQNSISWPALLTNETGSHTYQIQAKSIPGTGGACTATQVVLRLNAMFKTGA